MFRSLLLVTVTLIATNCTRVAAQGHHYHHAHQNHHRSGSRSSSLGIRAGTYPAYGSRGAGGFGYRYGYGYGGFAYPDPYRFDGFGYDPYRYGSFRAPDLMDDPYFKWQHKYDSHFPGRRSGRPPLVLKNSWD